MTYEAPKLYTPQEVYEAPILVNLEDYTAAEAGCTGCSTGGCIFDE
jgi:hypothetical protein